MKRKKQTARRVSDIERITAEFFFRMAEVAYKVDPVRYYRHIPSLTPAKESLPDIPKLWWLKGVNCLLSLHRLLQKYSLIEQHLSFEDFVPHFLDIGMITQPIKWRGQRNQLAYLINSLLQKEGDKFSDGFIKYYDKKMSVVVCLHFVDNSGNVIDSDVMKSTRGKGVPGAKAADLIDQLMNEFRKDVAGK